MPGLNGGWSSVLMFAVKELISVLADYLTKKGRERRRLKKESHKHADSEK